MTELNLRQLRLMADSASGALQKNARDNNRHVCIYLHWTAGHYNQFFNSYHISIDNNGKIYSSTNNLAELKSHTWQRNSGAVGIALNCAFNANTNNLGAEPPTAAQIDSLCQVVAILSRALNIPITSSYVMTHAEAAAQDGYGPGSGDPETRWDLWFLKNGDKPGTGGDNLRKIAGEYRNSSKLDWAFA